ncbi:epoxyqueuosine reductase QueH [Affinibrenneria salicis]|uniref:Epoxyqueuosine reductase QueH n=1 Tax=Affinibrenneria salicis TaxID=2590031 RepID=A0A5J5FXB5_9GAMM|nr:epoxyqueuosine reductase QueH [Affinibrenneria salicis]KAA8998113.1 epoxyqueuosine reductase QueH [Affinibrenneria salicis]
MTTLTLPADYAQIPGKKLQLPDDIGPVLMHCCCAPCSSAMIEACLRDGIRPTLFYYNPNIHPRAEYEVRKNELSRFAEALGLAWVDADYDREAWFEATRGLAHEPERGARCMRCFSLRMDVTARYAAQHDFSLFTTTLASSRWKDLNQVTLAGQQAAERYPATRYWAQDWRKNGLSVRKDALIKTIGFYQQQYCGCVYSLRDTNKWRQEHGRPPIEPGTGK